MRRYVDNRVVKGCLTAADSESSHTAFKQRDSPFEHVAGRVTDSAVTVPLHFEIEQSSTVLSAVEGVGNGLIDWYGDRPRRRIDFVATVNGERFVTQIPGATPICSLIVQDDCSWMGHGKSDNLHLDALHRVKTWSRCASRSGPDRARFTWIKAACATTGWCSKPRGGTMTQREA